MQLKNPLTGKIYAIILLIFSLSVMGFLVSVIMRSPDRATIESITTIMLILCILPATSIAILRKTKQWIRIMLTGFTIALLATAAPYSFLGQGLLWRGLGILLISLILLSGAYLLSILNFMNRRRFAKFIFWESTL